MNHKKDAETKNRMIDPAHQSGLSFMIFSDYPFSYRSVRATVCFTRWWAGVDNAWEQKEREARKMLENAADSHASGAHYAGQPFGGCYAFVVSFFSFNSRIILLAFWLFGSNLSDIL